MIEGTMTHSLLHRAVMRHLADVQGLTGVQVFVGRDGEWTEASRRGQVPPELHRRVLAAFDPEAGGAVEAMEGQGGWLATYMLGGPGVDLVLIFALGGLDPAQLQSRLAGIEAKVGWLMVAALADRRAAGESRIMGSEIGAQVLLDAAGARSRRILADQWIARLESAFSPGLVSVLWVSNGTPTLAAVSGGGLIERPSDARGDLEALAAIAVAARAPMLVAQKSRSRTTPEGLQEAPADHPDTAHAARREDEAYTMVDRLGGDRALILPIYEREETAAVVAMLFQGDDGLGLRVEGAEVVATLLGEAMTIQRRAHPRLLRRAWVWLGDGAAAVFGKTAWKLKLALVLIISAIAISSVVPSNYHPSFTARVEAGDRRIVSAPFDGFLAIADHQPGDRVEAGALLVAMEDTDIRLQIAQLRAGRAEIEAQVQTARAQRDAAQVRLLDARIAQSVAELSLLDRQLELSRFAAETDVIVLGGDAWRRVGDRVRLGEPLLELGAADSFRILAFIEEDWVADSPVGTTGTALLTAYPERPIPVRLVDIGADPQTLDGANTFPAWFALVDPTDLQILDGMRGVLRMDVAERSTLMAYSRGIRRWAARFVWRLGLDEAGE
jgi:hypothetical protein